MDHSLLQLHLPFTQCNVLSHLPVGISPITSIDSKNLGYITPASSSAYSTDSNSVSDGGCCDNERPSVPVLPMNFILEGRQINNVAKILINSSKYLIFRVIVS